MSHFAGLWLIMMLILCHSNRVTMYTAIDGDDDNGYKNKYFLIYEML